MEWNAKGMKRNCRVTVFRSSPLQWICREWGQKLGSDEATICFGDERHTESGGPTSQGEGTPRSRTRMRQPLSITQEPPPCFWASTVIYPFLPFILLLHLSVIHAYPQVHVPSIIFSGALWAVVTPSPCPRVTSTLKGVRVLFVCI